MYYAPLGVPAALACYFANKQQIDFGIAADEAEAKKIEKEFLDRHQVA